QVRLLVVEVGEVVLVIAMEESLKSCSF
ncbi:MAG: hypothetical protein PWQ31_1221, partial [Eubacteriales bacterium]|nr:hypothetical protein [Eubacteriales bacterium]